MLIGCLLQAVCVSVLAKTQRNLTKSGDYRVYDGKFRERKLIGVPRLVMKVINCGAASRKKTISLNFKIISVFPNEEYETHLLRYLIRVESRDRFDTEVTIDCRHLCLITSD